MKAHIGVDAHSGIVHSLDTTPANEVDVNKGHELLHGQEQMAFGDAGYQGIEKRIDEIKNPNTTWHVAMRPGKRKALGNSESDRQTPKVRQLFSVNWSETTVA